MRASNPRRRRTPVKESSNPPRMSQFRCGSWVRAALASRSSAATPRDSSAPEAARNRPIVSSSIATSSVPVRRYMTGMPLADVTRATNCSKRSRLRAASSRSGPSSRASIYGASTPADACVAPMPAGRSSTNLDRGAAAGQLVRDRTADDARADDHDVARGSHEDESYRGAAPVSGRSLRVKPFLLRQPGRAVLAITLPMGAGF